MLVHIKYTPNHFIEWNQFVSSEAQNATFLHERSYLDYHQNRFSDHSLLLFKNQKLIALFPANESGQMIYSHQGLTYGGLLVSKHFSADWAKECWRALLSYYALQGFRELIYKPVPAYYHSLPTTLFQITQPPSAELLEEGPSAVIHLQQIPKIKYRRARMIQKAKKAGLICIESEDWTGFWKLLSDNLLDRYNASPVHTESEICLLKSRFPSQIRLYVAQSEEKKILAGAVVFETKLAVHTQYLASNTTGRKIGALDWVVAHLMQRYKESHKYLSLGTVSDVKGEYRIHQGLKDWKDGFGAMGFAHYVYKVNLMIQ